MVNDRLVVWNIFFFHVIYGMSSQPHWLSLHHFSRWLKHVKTHQPVKSCQVMSSPHFCRDNHEQSPVSICFNGEKIPFLWANFPSISCGSCHQPPKARPFWHATCPTTSWWSWSRPFVGEKKRTVEGVIGVVFCFLFPSRKVVKRWSPGFWWWNSEAQDFWKGADEIAGLWA